MSILKDLYCGFLKPEKDFGTNTFNGYLALEQSAEQHMEKLLSGLSEEQVHQFKRFCNDHSDMAAMEQERMFIYAFKMGMEFMQEAILLSFRFVYVNSPMGWNCKISAYATYPFLSGI